MWNVSVIKILPAILHLFYTYLMSFDRLRGYILPGEQRYPWSRMSEPFPSSNIQMDFQPYNDRFNFFANSLGNHMTWLSCKQCRFSLIDTCSLQRLKPSDYILLTHTPKTLKRQLSCFGSPQISSCNRQETHCDYLGTFNACFSFLTKKKPLNAIVSMSLFISTWIHSNLFIVEITPTSILLWQK